tara:strand:+ start:150 stop:1472 length:1323 start_codon:yes stop_codon:yes gene_type:complete
MVEQTFAQQTVTEELTESDRIRKRITEFKSSLNPNVLGVISLMIDNQLKSGMIKPADLDAIVALRDEINKAQIEYNTQIQNAQKRLTDLAEIDQAEQIAKQEAAIQAIKDGETAERQRRKEAEQRLANMEAVLLSHGISMDLNADGKVGLQSGQTATQLTAQEQAQVDAMVQVEKDNIATAPVQPSEPKEPSRAFQMARMVNPVVEEEPFSNDEDFVEKVEETKKAFKDFVAEEPTPEIEVTPTGTSFTPTGTTTESFLDEVERVNEVAEADEELSDEDYAPVRQELADGVYIEERETPEPAPSPSAPVISNSQRPEEPSLDIGYEEPKESIPTYDTEEDMLAAAQEKLDNAQVEEEEYEEVTIPSESELKAMTKAAILEQGKMLDFVLDTKDTKAVMIASFLTQVDEFIASLQESGEFVSAENDEGENDNPNIQDGGYF